MVDNLLRDLSHQFLPDNQTYWYLSEEKPRVLIEDATYDVVIIGGGMAGLSAAQSFKSRGLSVALLEKNFCGSGASGKSSGFINADSEISLMGFVDLYGQEKAMQIWDFGLNGVEFIRNNIKNYSLKCDYQEQDTLVLATSLKDFNAGLIKENKSYSDLGLRSTLYNKNELSNLINTDKYFGAIKYHDTFGINAYLYCKSMKKMLESLGVDIYEESPVLNIVRKSQDYNIVQTHYANVKAKYIILCVDRFLPKFDILRNEIYQTQSFLAMSAPLTNVQVEKIFLDKRFMCWDTELTYKYFRITGDNRLMIGGTSIWDIYTDKEKYNNSYMFNQLVSYIKNKFPQIKVNFEYFWPGLIGVTKDIIPLAGKDKDNSNIYYISGAAGLPWAAGLGEYSAKSLIDKETRYDHFFDPYRKFPVNNFIQSIIGKKASFALSNYLTLKQFV